MARFIKDPDLALEFGTRSRELIAPFTSARAAEVLAGVALEARRTRRTNIALAASSSISVWFFHLQPLRKVLRAWMNSRLFRLYNHARSILRVCISLFLDEAPMFQE